MNLSLRLIAISLFVLLFSACQSVDEQSAANKSENTVGMLQHTVYFYLNDDVTSEGRKQFEAGLKKLLEISDIYKAELGIPAGTEEREVTDHSFGYSVYTWFETMEDYKGYDEHPDHKEFIDTYSHLWADVKVYDSDIMDVR